MTPQLPKLNASLIKVVGVFNYTKKQKLSLKKMGYRPLPICIGHENDQNFLESDVKFIKDNYYEEFADLFFNTEKPLELPWYLDKKYNVQFLKGTANNLSKFDCTIVNPELYFFPGDTTGIFTFQIEISENSLEMVSDITYCASLFEGPYPNLSNIMFEGNPDSFHSWISKFILSDIPLRGKNVQSDKFSGSKFKLFTILDIANGQETDSYDLDFLMYEIATRSKLMTMADNGYNAPSHEYYKELMKDKISVFKNYQGLALLDSFTILGNNIYPAEVKSERDLQQQNLFKRIYFSMYVFNLYVRYSVFRFNATFKEDEVKKRDEFEDFINHYNLKHVSFNFLPNIFFNKMRSSMMIDEEIQSFESRLQRLAGKIQEDESKRQALLLTVISALSSISAIEPVWSLLNSMNDYLQLSNILFYTLVFILLLAIAIPVLAFVFPTNYKRFKKFIGLK